MSTYTRLIKYSVFSVLLSIIVVITISISCDIKSPVQDVKIIINSKPINTIISGMILNSATNEPLIGKQVTLTIEGQNQSDIVDLTAEPQTKFSTSQGMVGFALTNDFIPSATAPAKVVLVARADGFLPTSIPLNIHKTGAMQFSIHMIELNNPPNGVAIATGTGKAGPAGALLNNDLELTAMETETGAFTSLRIPVGTKIKDESGSPLTGSITANIVYCTNQSRESLISFPGGFLTTINKAGVLTEVTFFTGGFAAIEIKDQNGRIAKTFNNQVEVTIQVPPETGNPETSSNVKNGDQVDLWSYDMETSIWNHEKRATISGPDAQGNFSVNYQTNHLSYWNIDWCGPEGHCWASRKINIVGKPDGYPLWIIIQTIPVNNNMIEKMEYDNWIILEHHLPEGIPILFLAYDGYDRSKLVGTLQVDEICDAGDLTLSVNIQTPTPPPMEVILHCEGWCTCNPDLIIRPNGNPIWYRLMDANNYTFWLYAGETQNGKITIPGILIDRYYHYGTWYEDEYDPDGQVETGWYEIKAIIHQQDFKAEIWAVSHNVDSVYTYFAKEYNKPVLYFREQLPPIICSELCAEAEEP